MNRRQITTMLRSRLAGSKGLISQKLFRIAHPDLVERLRAARKRAVELTDLNKRAAGGIGDGEPISVCAEICGIARVAEWPMNHSPLNS